MPVEVTSAFSIGWQASEVYLALQVLKVVAEQGGYFYEGLPSVRGLGCSCKTSVNETEIDVAQDPLSLFRCLTASQARPLCFISAARARSCGALMMHVRLLGVDGGLYRGAG